MAESIIEEQMEIPAKCALDVFGQFDANARKIERAFRTTLVERNGTLRIVGPESGVRASRDCIAQLTALSERGEEISEQKVNYIISLAMEQKSDAVLELDGDIICHTINGKPVKPGTLGQKKYVDAFRADEVGRIILTRPAIEAGEKLGFLPGDLQSKIDPYLRPLYDALYQIMGAETFQRNMEKGLIEVAPLAYMRGRTLDNAYIILDEAQNTTPAQMKMFLTRIGYGSKVVVTGDMTQKDIPAGSVSGLDVAARVLKKIDGIAFCTLTSRDVVRHPLVQKIVEAYEAYEKASSGAREGRSKNQRKRRAKS